MRCRLWLVRRQLAKRKHSTVTASRKHVSKNIVPGLLLSGIIISSGAVGFLLAGTKFHTDTARELHADAVPRLMAAQAIDRSDQSTNQIPEIGQIQAEILRLRILFLRLAEVAELDDGEFDLDAPVIEPKSKLKVSKNAATGNLALSIATLGHISMQADRMSSIFDDRRLANAQRVSGRAVQQGHLSSGFGYRQNPVTGVNKMHRGLDYSGDVGEPVLALADGIVTYSGVNGGYGNLVELEHSDGFHTRYAHNDGNLVRVGQRVRKGVVIATLGSTGQSTGPHVHVEVRQHQMAVDPAFFLR